MNITPSRQYVWIKKLPEPDVTKSGLMIPESAQRKPETAQVLAVGKGKITKTGVETEPLVSPGDIVYIHRNAYAGIGDVGGRDCTIIHEDSILAIIE